MTAADVSGFVLGVGLPATRGRSIQHGGGILTSESDMPFLSNRTPLCHTDYVAPLLEMGAVHGMDNLRGSPQQLPLERPSLQRMCLWWPARRVSGDGFMETLSGS